MDGPTLQWSAAEVQDGTLRVPIDGERPKGWKATFARTVTLLGGGAWGEVSLKQGIVSVTAVSEGSEDELHHFLEGAVQQANATHAETGERSAEEAEDATGDDADSRMTSRFRDFDAT